MFVQNFEGVHNFVFDNFLEDCLLIFGIQDPNYAPLHSFGSALWLMS